MIGKAGKQPGLKIMASRATEWRTGRRRQRYLGFRKKNMQNVISDYAERHEKSNTTHNFGYPFKLKLFFSPAHLQDNLSPYLIFLSVKSALL